MIGQKGVFLMTIGLIASAGFSVSAEDQASAIRTLRNGDLKVEVMNPNSPERYNRGVRFSPAATVLKANYRGKDYLYAPAEHNPIKENGGLAMEFDLLTPPPGFQEAKMGEGFVKIGVGVLKKDRECYSFWADYEPVKLAATDVDWKERGAVFSQACDGINGYSYRLIAEVAVRKDSVVIDYRLTNTGERSIATEHYAHNFFAFDENPVGPGYTVSFPYGYKATGLLPEQVQKERTIYFEKEIPKAVNIKVLPPNGYEGENALSVRCENGMGIDAITSIPGHYTAIHASKKYVCPEQFVKISLKPGESKSWTRRYRFIQHAFDVSEFKNRK